MDRKRIFVLSRLPLMLHSITTVLSDAATGFRVTGTVTEFSSDENLALADSEAAVIHLCPQTELNVAVDFVKMLHHEFGLKVIVLGDLTDRIASELAMQDFVCGFIDHFASADQLLNRVTELLEMDASSLRRQSQGSRSPRLDVSIPVRVDGQLGYSKNISATGLYLQIDTGKEYFVGEEIGIEIDLELPSGESVLMSRGEIVRTESFGGRLGIAIKILETSVVPSCLSKM